MHKSDKRLHTREGNRSGEKFTNVIFNLQETHFGIQGLHLRQPGSSGFAEVQHCLAVGLPWAPCGGNPNTTNEAMDSVPDFNSSLPENLNNASRHVFIHPFNMPGRQRRVGLSLPCSICDNYLPTSVPGETLHVVCVASTVAVKQLVVKAFFTTHLETQNGTPKEISIGLHRFCFVLFLGAHCKNDASLDRSEHAYRMR